MIQMDEADKLERNWCGEKCDHNWEKELFLALKPAIIVAKFSVQLALKWICTIIKKNSVFVHKKNQGEYCVL